MLIRASTSGLKWTAHVSSLLFMLMIVSAYRNPRIIRTLYSNRYRSHSSSRIWEKLCGFSGLPFRGINLVFVCHSKHFCVISCWIWIWLIVSQSPNLSQAPTGQFKTKLLTMISPPLVNRKGIPMTADTIRNKGVTQAWRS